MKDIKGKSRVDLIPWEGLSLVGKVFEFGSIKYTKHDWRKGRPWTTYAGAIIRHTYQWLSGENDDPESKLPHMAHVAANAIMLLTIVTGKKGIDDRYSEK